MKFIVNLSTNKLMSVYKSNKTVETRKNCYSVLLDINEEDLVKQVKKGFWTHLKDDNGNLLWQQDSDTLKPLMGYAISDKEVEINIFNHLEFWTLQEILELKYRSKLEKSKYSHVFYEEFIDEDLKRKIDGNLHIGKKICYGNGKITLELEMKDDEITFDCEYNGNKPNISLKKGKGNKIYLQIDDDKNQLTSYAIYFNSNINEEKKYIGQGILKKN